MIKKNLVCFIIVFLFFFLIVSAEDICQFATSANATSENTGSESIYATGAPDSNEDCNIWSGQYKSWSPKNWNIKTNLTLNYDTPVYAKNLTIFGDYNICWNKIWLKNSTSEEELLIYQGNEYNCVFTKNLDGDFLADTIILETCGWAWSSTDAVEICGDTNLGPICGDNITEGEEECDDGNTINGDGCSRKCKIENLSAYLCQYADSATATNELPGYEAIYSTNLPDSDKKCSTLPTPHTSWQKTNWDVIANLTLTFPYPIYPDNLTILGDYDLCINRIWLWRNNAWYLIQKGVMNKGIGENCNINYNFNSLNFKINKIKLETCGWTWSVIDAVQFCGSINSFPKISIINPIQDRIINNSENSIMLEISTDIVSECKFSYDKNFNFNKGTTISTTDGIIHTYNLIKPISEELIKIYYKCKGNNSKINPYSMVHRFSFKEIDNPFIEVCNWYDCSEGAVSISMDTCYNYQHNIIKAVCKQELEKNNFKGTYFLTYTNGYNESNWNLWTEIYNLGHEIGGHSQSHSYSDQFGKEEFIEDIQSNIDDIINNTGMPKDELITYAWPGGVTTPNYEKWLSDYYLFSRGYYFNTIESKNPQNFMNYKSINSFGFGMNPPDYYLLADTTENHQDWANYIYHDNCDNPEIIDYLSTKSLWTETIGTVSKYIKERNDVTMKNIENTSTRMKFDLISHLNTTIFNKKLTLQIYLGNNSIDNITINGENTEFIQFIKANQTYIKFNVPSLEINKIEITGLKIDIPYCGDNKTNQKSEKCDDGNTINGDGCDENCKDETEIYILSYMANIDGSVAPEWYPFYDKITKYYEDTQIPVGVSFFPATINSDDEYFSKIFKRMYLTENIELGQKGFNINETEEHLNELSIEEQKQVIKNGQYYYIDKMKEILNSTEINIPVTYIAPFSRFTNDTRKVLEELGFKTNFGLYYQDDLGPVKSTATLDSIQYGVSFTVNGAAGRETTFKQPDEIIQEILSYNRLDIEILTINGKKAIPLYVHQPDFEDPIINNKIDEEKWEIYNETLTKLLENPNITFLTPNQAWDMKHRFCIPTGITENFCNRIDDNCNGKIDEDYVATVTTCGIGACQSTGMLECITYEFDTCEPGIPTTEICDDEIDNDCDGLTDNQDPDCGLVPICQFATSANATSENTGSESIYATGAPDSNEDCNIWSGQYKSWSPKNWNIKTNLTLNYDTPVYAKNLTIFGDYNICWNKIWLKNSTSEEELLIYQGNEYNCVFTKNLDGDFLADTIILETCGWAWSSTDAVEICGMLG